MSLFKEDELKRFVRRGPMGEAILAQVNVNQAFEAFAADLVDALVRNNLINDGLFTRLCRVRALRADEIDAVRRRCLKAVRDPERVQPRVEIRALDPAAFTADSAARPDEPTQTDPRPVSVRTRSFAGWRVLAGLVVIAIGAALALRWTADDVGSPREKGFVAIDRRTTNLAIVHRHKFRSLLFAAHDYGSSFTDLRTPKNDIDRIGALLQNRFGFEVTKYPNATRSQIIDALDGLTTGPEDAAVIIYFAGHGVYKDRLKGFWIPSDATKSSATWVSSNDVLLRVQAAVARHVLVISDSCFSAALLRSDDGERRNGYPSAALRSLAGRRSRVVMTSGGKQAVIDEGIGGMSAFAFRLHELLRSASDPYVVLPSDIFDALRRRVAEDTRRTTRQTPEFGKLLGAGHSGGEMVLVRTRRRDSSAAGVRGQ